MPEWDIVAESTDGKKLLLGEAKWSASAVTALGDQRRRISRREPPIL